MAVIMTEMGDDGARGMANIKASGAHIQAQKEKSCVVFGMPKEAIERGAACEVVSIDRMAGAILAAAGRP